MVELEGFIIIDEAGIVTPRERRQPLYMTVERAIAAARGFRNAKVYRATMTIHKPEDTARAIHEPEEAA